MSHSGPASRRAGDIGAESRPISRAVDNLGEACRGSRRIKAVHGCVWPATRTAGASVANIAARITGRCNRTTQHPTQVIGNFIMLRSNTARLALAAALGWQLFAVIPAQASSHMDAPLISLDDAANTTDVYAFKSKSAGIDYLTTALAVYPFEEPGIGPNIYGFDPKVDYEIHVATGQPGEQRQGRHHLPLRIQDHLRQPQHHPAELSRRGRTRQTSVRTSRTAARPTRSPRSTIAMAMPKRCWVTIFRCRPTTRAG